MEKAWVGCRHGAGASRPSRKRPAFFSANICYYAYKEANRKSQHGARTSAAPQDHIILSSYLFLAHSASLLGGGLELTVRLSESRDGGAWLNPNYHVGPSPPLEDVSKCIMSARYLRALHENDYK